MKGRAGFGRQGEDIALEYLEGLGMKLLARNWKHLRKELDLVMESAGAVHVVEVKTLKAPSPIEPWQHVDASKIANLTYAASHFVTENHIRKEVQFDIVSIVMYGDEADIRYIPNAFYPIKV